MQYDQKIDTPTIDECFGYFDQFKMLDNIRDHSMQVARVALVIQQGLSKKSPIFPSFEVIAAGALLHDIAKTICLHNDCRHATVGREICEELGYPEIGNIVQHHVILTNFQEEKYKEGIFSAEEIVYYSDKRVRHDQVVSLQDRFDYIMDVYGKRSPQSADIINRSCRECLLLEKYIYNGMDFSPQDVPELVKKITFTSF